MRKDIADMWVSALRSGEYAQTKKFLRKGGGFCCLGVLCDLHQRRTNAGEWQDHEDGLEAVYKTGKTSDDASRTRLPKGVYEWADCSGDPSDAEVGLPLALLNDDHGYTFDQLADLIETQWGDL
jgi:hypothetical protein